MIYFDTNIFVYALSQNVDDISQKERALKYLREAIEGFKKLQKYVNIEIEIL